MYFHVFQADLQNLFSAFLPFSQKNLRRFFARRRFACFCYFSIFFSKCKQFLLLVLTKCLIIKWTQWTKIIKISFSKNNVHMKINKVNTNIKMCLHHALCFWLGHTDRYSNHVIRISVLFCWWEGGRKS